MSALPDITDSAVIPVVGYGKGIDYGFNLTPAV